jgi:hypothetical protein
MVTRTLIAIAIVLAAHTAHAGDAPITVQLGAGTSVMRFTSDDVAYELDDSAWRAALALRADFGFRVHPNVSVGVHTGISTSASATQFVFLGSGPGPAGEMFPIRYLPFEIGLGATFTHDRIWFAPWFGLVDIQFKDGNDGISPPRQTAFGFDAGYDLAVDPAGHRFGVIASLSHSGDWNTDPSASTNGGFLALTVGASYRFW